MKIYLLDNNPVICKTWNLYFEDEREVEIVCDDFKHFMDTEKSGTGYVECVMGSNSRQTVTRQIVVK